MVAVTVAPVSVIAGDRPQGDGQTPFGALLRSGYGKRSAVTTRVPDLDLGMTDGLPNQALDLVAEVS
jgi:hypothetical protein